MEKIGHKSNELSKLGQYPKFGLMPRKYSLRCRILSTGHFFHKSMAALKIFVHLGQTAKKNSQRIQRNLQFSKLRIFKSSLISKFNNPLINLIVRCVPP